MKNRIKRALNRELKNVRIDDALRARILADVAGGRFRRERRPRFAPMLAAAAAVVAMVAIGWFAGHPERPVHRDVALSDGELEWVWVCEDDALYHARKNCGGMEGAEQVSLERAKADGRTACADCIRPSAASSEGGAPSGEAGAISSASPRADETATPRANEAATPRPTDEAGLQASTSAPAASATSAADSTAMPAPTADLGVELPGSSLEAVERAGSLEAAAIAGEAPEGSESPAASVETANELPAASDDAQTYVEDVFLEGAGLDASMEHEVELLQNAGCSPGIVGVSGDCFHLDWGCDGIAMDDTIELAAAVSAGYSPCPDCANVYVWATESGRWFHTARNCKSMQNARLYTLDEAIGMGKEVCATCVGYSTVWMTDAGDYIHTARNCSGMRGAIEISVTEMPLTKHLCAMCYGEPCIWTTEKSDFYHVDFHCAELSQADALEVCESEMLGKGKAPCPACAGASVELYDAPVAAFSTEAPPAGNEAVAEG